VKPAVLSAMRGLAAMDGKEKEEEIGYKLSINILKELLKVHSKFHLMTHNRFELCKNIIKESIY
jgi:5,10-methylenetetrahydrofolate reductase